MISHFLNIIEISNQFFSNLLSQIPYNPSKFYNFLPPLYSKDSIEQFYIDKVFFSPQDLAPAFTYCILFSIIRYFIQNYFIQPFIEIIFCKSYSSTTSGVSKLVNSPINFTFIDSIENDLKFNKKNVDYQLFSSSKVNKSKVNKSLIINRDYIQNYSVVSGRSVSDIRTYLYNRKKYFVLNKKIVKFVEALWRFLFYLYFSYLGYNCLFKDPSVVPWLIDTNENWKDWPFHSISSSIIFYYHIELGCYLHQLIWTEVSRKDALEMILHHIITVCLIVVSFMTKFIRVGTIILFLHDLSDIFLEIAKVFNYIINNNKRLIKYKVLLVDSLFAIFTLVFFCTRLYYYPFVILKSVFTEGYNNFLCEWYGCYFFVSFLVALQCLHIFWFFFIVRMIIRLMNGTMNKDERSEDDEELIDDSEVEENKQTKEIEIKKNI